MKGSPIRELLLVLGVALVLLWPLMQLTGARRRVEPDPLPVVEADGGDQVDTWVEVLFSHPPQHVRLKAGDTILLDSGGELLAEVDAVLGLHDGIIQIGLIIEWPDSVQQGYVELRVEPERLPVAKAGAWGRGTQEELFEFAWPEEAD